MEPQYPVKSRYDSRKIVYNLCANSNIIPRKYRKISNKKLTRMSFRNTDLRIYCNEDKDGTG